MTRTRLALARAGLGFALLGTCTIPAYAVDLPFDATCRLHSRIAVQAPSTGILFRKNPNSSVTRAATATIFRIGDVSNVVVPVGGASCFYQVRGSDDYCFQARSNAAVGEVNAVPGTNTAGAPACQ